MAADSECLRKINGLIGIFEEQIDYESFMLSTWLKGLYSGHKAECIKNIRLYTTVSHNINDSVIHKIQKLIEIPNAVSNIIKFVKQNNDTFELLCSGYFRELKLKSILSVDIIWIINTFCTDHYLENLQYDAVRILENISSGTSQQTKCIIDDGGIEILIETFNKSLSSKIKSSTLQVLGRIGLHCVEFRDLILNQNILNYILKYTKHPLVNDNKYSKTLSEGIGYFLGQCFNSTPLPSSWKYIEIAVKIISNMIEENDGNIYDLEAAIYYLSAQPNDNQSNKRIQLIIDNGIVPYLLKILQTSSIHIAHIYALRIFGNIMMGGNDEQIQYVITNGDGILKSFNNLISMDTAYIEPGTCRFLLPIASSDAQNIISRDLVQPLVDCMYMDNLEVSQQVMSLILNAITDASDDCIEHYIINIDTDIIFAICNICNNVQKQRDNDEYKRLLLMALEAIEMILINGESVFDDEDNLYAQYMEECGGLSILESLYMDSMISTAVRSKIGSIVNSYFENDNF